MDYIKSAKRKSLQSLCVPRVAIFYLHGPDASVPIQRALDALEAMLNAHKAVQARPWLGPLHAWLSVLPPAGWVQPPLAMDGIPAPDSAVTPPHVRNARR